MSDELDNNASSPESGMTGGQPEASVPPAPETPASNESPTGEAPASDAPANAAAPVESYPADDDAPTDSIVRGPAFSDSDEAAPLEELMGVEDDDRPKATGDRKWYILKVQVNREDAIRDSLERRVRVAGLQDFFADIVVPDEKRTEFKNGKKKVVRVKLYPGYLIVNMELNDVTWLLVRETSGIGDFTTSGGKPTPMSAADVAKIIKKTDEKTEEAPKLKIPYKTGDRVRINDGMFANFEGSVEGIDETNGRVTVMINIFGRSTPVELEYWQIENL